VGLTARTSTLFGPAGTAYVYRSYGIHALLNAVCEAEDVGAAVLIRAVEPVEGLEAMCARRGLARVEDLCSGPGKLTQAMGIGLDRNATSLVDGPVRIRPRAAGAAAPDVVVSTRVGITRATELEWRFCALGSRCVSRPWPPGLRASLAA
jgi:DNA-3-methyladenine glycosylase